MIMLLYQILASTIYGKYKNVIKINKFKVPAPMLNNIFELPVESCSVSDVHAYFGYIIKK